MKSKLNLVFFTDLEHSSPRIPNLISHLNKEVFNIFIIGADYTDRLTKNDFPENFPQSVNFQLFKRKINLFNFLKKNIEGSKSNESKIKSSAAYLSLRSIFINILLSFSFPDQYFLTINKYIRKFNELNLKNEVVIISSSPYVSTHFSAYKIKAKLKSKVTWYADYRDLWSLNHNYSFSKLRLLIDKIIEKKIMKHPDYITTTTKTWVERQSKFLKRRVEFLPNGYSSFDNLKLKKQNKFNDKDIIRVLYVGAMSFGFQDFNLLFDSLKDFKNPNFEIHFIGRYSFQLQYLINKFNLSKTFRQLGLVSREKSKLMQKNYDFLLLVDSKKQTGEILLKFYEYIGANRPIICIGGNEKTEHQKILKKLNRGNILNNKDEVLNFFLNIQKQTDNIVDTSKSFEYSYKNSSQIFQKMLLNNFKEK